ncbi:bromodomain-containing protein DDB_G0278469-like [Papaver somniferum]|uniref:bromodomain-containing protein DDB_G0278469-like n=1 Tax=Papaver somniferum TaxID=3469 RepID=UPI000E702CC3|nr:bromodomain-containing protein DDB_G0278469-like [Papaver somniferum]
MVMNGAVGVVDNEVASGLSYGGAAMKNKQNTQQSPTESASLTSKLQPPTQTKSPTPSLSPGSRRSSQRNKKLEPSTVVSSLTKCATTPKRRLQPESAEMSSPTTKRQATRKKNVQSESAQHSQTTTTKSQSKSSEGDTEKYGVGRKNVKRKLDTSSTGPCLNVQLRDPHDTLADFQDEEEEEEEEEAVEEDNSDHVEPDVEEENDNDSADPKRTISFNSNEQPIGDPSVQLASVLGVLVRKLPLTYKDWRLVPYEAKENIWKIVSNRFIVPEYYKDYYFSKMGTYLREARSRKAGLVLDALDRLQGEEQKKRLEKLMPRTMTVREWEEFVKHVDSIEFRSVK